MFIGVIPSVYVEGVYCMAYIDIVKGLREDHDLKQAEIAAALGISQQHYSKYETGEHEMPIRILVAIADYYKVSTDYVLGRTKCREGVDGTHAALMPGYTAGNLTSDVLALDAHGRESVVEYVEFQKYRAGQKAKAKK